MLNLLWRKIEFFAKEIKVWHFCNIYPNAEIGLKTSIGSYTEIGKNVKIGSNCRIGAHVFIPECVSIGDNVFIGPSVTFTNDKYPPSGSEHWQTTVVNNNASIGAGSVILPGIVIHEGALVGAGSVVTKDIPAGEVWCGVPAKLL